MLKLKNILNDLVDYVYDGHEKQTLYKKFYIEFIDKKLRSRHGCYKFRTHHIEICNLYRDDAAIVATSVHELAHHVDYINRHTSDHGPEFYAIYEKLLHGALDMGLFGKGQFLTATRDASDSNKIAKMIADYTPKNIGYKTNKKLIYVFNAYSVKDALKADGYHYNGNNNTWEKEIEESEIAAEADKLRKLSVTFDVKDFTSLTFQTNVKIYATDGSFEFKDDLKEQGFRFDGKRSAGRKMVMRQNSGDSRSYFLQLFSK